MELELKRKVKEREGNLSEKHNTTEVEVYSITLYCINYTSTERLRKKTWKYMKNTQAEKSYRYVMGVMQHSDVMKWHAAELSW